MKRHPFLCTHSVLHQGWNSVWVCPSPGTLSVWCTPEPALPTPSRAATTYPTPSNAKVLAGLCQQLLKTQTMHNERKREREKELPQNHLLPWQIKICVISKYCLRLPGHLLHLPFFLQSTTVCLSPWFLYWNHFHKSHCCVLWHHLCHWPLLLSRFC